ncbi:hypothetical protein CEXT_457251 [Caerostris extrusa]|uniref:Secreted protein n=1 Tax=Caerostris extrusa TaxID=172846 RepID=A0AAV4PSS9_CAEEX|nr:hypothetical protein CEXT_457251 [Caerostris extrusa]
MLSWIAFWVPQAGRGQVAWLSTSTLLQMRNSISNNKVQTYQVKPETTMFSMKERIDRRWSDLVRDTTANLPRPISETRRILPSDPTPEYFTIILGTSQC